MKNFLYENRQIDESTETTRTPLIKEKLTLKLVRDITVIRNSKTTKVKRFQYAINLTDGTVDINKCIFIDESGFHYFMRRSFGRSLRGTRSYRQCLRLKDPNTSLCMAISKDGVIHHKIKSEYLIDRHSKNSWLVGGCELPSSL